MAIDSRDKRMSLIVLDLPGRVLPSPSGTLNAQDRVQLAGKYSGFVTGDHYTGNAAPYFLTRVRRL